MRRYYTGVAQRSDIWRVGEKHGRNHDDTDHAPLWGRRSCLPKVMLRLRYQRFRRFRVLMVTRRVLAFHMRNAILPPLCVCSVSALGAHDSSRRRVARPSSWHGYALS